MDIGQSQFLQKALLQAEQSGHIWPKMAAAEAALESNFGRSQLAIQASNLFGMKLHQKQGNSGDYISIPSREFIGHQWVTLDTKWCKYADWQECFEDRMFTLRRLAPTFPNYAAALVADTPEQYIVDVSKSWSTDPERAAKVLVYYTEMG